MHIKCESCGTRYSLDAERIKGDSVTIKCPNCHKSMVVQKPQISTTAVTTHTVGPGPTQKARKGKKPLNGNGTGSDLDLTIEDLAAFQDLDLSLLEDSGVFSVDLPVKDHDALDLEDRVSYDFSDVDVSALDEDSYSQGKVVSVEFEPPPGSYSAAQSVALSTRTPQAVIYYTTDGSEPGEDSEGYLDPIDVVETATIKAIAIKSGWEPSDPVEAVYQITGKAGYVTFLPEPGEFALETKVELTCATPNSKIYYTTDGKEPTPKSNVFEKAITIPEESEVTIKARAYKEGWEPGDVESGTYKVTGHVKEITFSVEPGVYTSGLEVALSCQTPKAQIHYTVDGNEPNLKSPKYTKPLSIEATTTAKARAFLKGWTPSDLLTGTFTITGKVKTPVVTPEPGVYPQPQQVTIACPDKEAAILFTTDGSDPNENSPVFSKALEISAPTVIKAVAVIPGWEPSDGIIAEYEITGQAAKPTCHPKPGSYDNPIEIALESSTPGVVIHFTLDGSDPTEKSSNFGSPIKLAESTTLKARAFKPGWEPSQTFEAEYKIVQTVSGPAISPSGGRFDKGQTVSISSGTPDVKIFYTLDGNEPTEKKHQYSKPFDVNESSIVKARAFRKGWTPSDIVTAEFTITRAVAPPVVSPSGGQFDKSQTVSLSCETSDAVLYYTLDNSDPTEKSSKYEKTIEVADTATLKVRAFKDGWEPSEIVTADFTITRTVAAPVMSPSGGQFDKAQSVSMSCETSDAMLYYTLDNSDPTEKSSKYETPVEIVESSTLKAIAFKDGWEPSEIATAEFTITHTVATPVMSPSGGQFDQAQSVSMSCETSDAVLFYTLDGSDPTEKSSRYEKPIDIADTTTLKVRAFKGGWEPSDIATAEFVVTRTVAPPVMSPSGGQFDKSQTVSLSCETSDAVLYYTLDNSDPTEKSSRYKTPIDIAESTTLKAKAFKDGWEPSDIATTEFVVTRTVAPPVASPSGGQFDKSQTVSLSCETSDAVLYYTLDNSDPTEKSSKYAKPIDIADTTTLKVRAFKGGWEPSEIVTGEFTISRIVAEPIISPAGGAFTIEQTIDISCSTEDADIHYTTDGNDPEEKSTWYSGPIKIKESAILKARGFKKGWTPSRIVQSEFTITHTVALPMVSPAGGQFGQTQSVSMSCDTSDAVLYYTLDSSDPTESSQKYSEPMELAESSTLKARAFKDGWEPSDIATAEFTITHTVATPVMSPSGGQFDKNQSVSMSCDTSDAVLYYTLDSSDPTEASSKYTEPMELAESSTLKARAFKDGWEPSDIATAEFTITHTVATPVMSPSGGQFDKNQSVSMSCDTSDAVLYYTLDSSDPTEASSKYTEPMELAESSTLKVRAFREGWEPSDIATAEFTITRTVALPVVSPAGGQFDQAQSVSMTCDTSDAALYYTLDSSDPTENSSKYGEPIEIAESSTLKVRAFKDGWEPSAIVIAEYEVTRKTGTPEFNPPPAEYAESVQVSISTPTPNAVIHYTIDGTDPEVSAPVYDDPIVVLETTTIKAFAVVEGWEPSDIVAGEFWIPEEELAHEETQPPEDAIAEEPAEAPEEEVEPAEAPEEEVEPAEAPEEEVEPEETSEEEVEPEETPEEEVEPEEAEGEEMPPWAKPAAPREPGRIVPFPKIALDGTAMETYVGKDGPEYGYEPLDVEGPPPPTEPTPADEPAEPQDIEEAVVVEEPEPQEVTAFAEEVAEEVEEPKAVEEDVVDLAAYEEEEEPEEDTAFDEKFEEPEEDSVALGAYQSEQADDIGDIQVEPIPDDEAAFTPFESFEPPTSEPELPPPPPEESEVLDVSAEPDLGAPTAEELEAERIAEEEAQAAREAEKEAERLAKEAEKEAEKAAREAEKEAERAAKEAEKEAQRKAKEAEKADKEAEKEARRKAKEQARQLKPERETNWRMIGIIAAVLVLVAVGAGLVLVLPSHMAKSEAKATWQGYQVLKDLDSSVKANIPYEDYGTPVTRSRVEIDKLKDNPAYEQLNEIMTLYEVAGDLWDAKEFREEANLVDVLKKVCPLAEKLANTSDSSAREDALQAKIACAAGYYSGVFAEAEKPSTEPVKPDPRLVHVDAVLKMLWAHASDKLEAFAKLNKPE